MLPFSSITSIIPLFVLGFAYLVFVGTSVLSKGNTDTGRAFDEIKVIGYQSADKFQNENTCHWSSIASTDAGTIEDTDVAYSFEGFEIGIRIPDEIIYSEIHTTGLSIRPPPALS
ncbi:MAG TPA: hypothetical protein VK213_04615 [Bacteroidales bacterium]|nr:hypothetical protein [Bacteroidales bacterium]